MTMVTVLAMAIFAIPLILVSGIKLVATGSGGYDSMEQAMLSVVLLLLAVGLAAVAWTVLY